MTNPINSHDPARRVDALIHDIYATQSHEVRYDVALDDSRPSASDDSARDAIETVHRVAEGIHVGAVPLEATSFGVLSSAIAPIALGTVMYTGMEIDRRAGDLQSQQLQYDRMRGILAALEQRSDSPEVVAEAARNRHFARGLVDASNVDPVLFFKAQAAVAHSRDEGCSSVALGTDHGRAFNRRYHADLAFHHAVDYARRAREDGGEAWDAIVARAEPQREALELGAASVPVRP